MHGRGDRRGGARWREGHDLMTGEEERRCENRMDDICVTSTRPQLFPVGFLFPGGFVKTVRNLKGLLSVAAN